METAFQKLTGLSEDGGEGSITSSHPASAKRSERAKNWAVEEGAKKP
ncbi:MAG: hypothetical protein WA810_11060 [Maribacter sp.]